MASKLGFCYFVSFVDDFSRFMWIFPMRYKFDVHAIFIAFQCYVECQFTVKIKQFQSNGGGEF